MKLENKVAIVVGGGSGVGRASSKLFAKEGAKVMLCDLVKENADKVAAEIAANGGEVTTFQMDMTKEEDCVKMAEATVAKYGKIDILCNIAGGSIGPNIRENLVQFVDQDKAMWDRIIDINLNGARNCTKAILPYMIEKQYGKIVSFSSIAAINGMSGGSDYAAAKAGIIAFMKSIALEQSSNNIYANTITPSATMSERIRKHMEGRQQAGQQQSSLSMFAEPEELAEAVLVLVSSASDHVSGQNIIFGVPTQPRTS